MTPERQITARTRLLVIAILACALAVPNSAALTRTPAGSGNLASGPLLSGPQSWITILCRFADSPEVTPAPPSYYAGLMIGGSQTADSYWREVSYNNINLTGSGNVVGWVNMSGSRFGYESAHGSLRLLPDCAAAADAFVNFADYAGINFVFNQPPNATTYGGGTTGLTIDGVSRSWRTTRMFGAYPLGGLIRAMGLSFGLPPSSGPYGQAGDSLWDVMSAAVPVHTISHHKDVNGWIPADRIVTVEGGTSAVVTLDALSLPATSSAPLMVKIPVGSSFTRFYTVELRRPTGLDSALAVPFSPAGNAIVIHDVSTNRSTQALVVDPDNNGNPNDAGASWTVGEVFTDGANGIRVEITAETSSSVTVVITNAGLSLAHVFFGTLAGLSGAPGAIDGTGSAARFNGPDGIAVDDNGTVYVADSSNHVIRKISPAGIVTTLAGLPGSQGSTDGAGAAARFSFPRGVAVGPGGIVYVADFFSRIRKITPDGIVSTLAQVPFATAVAVDGAGTVYVTSLPSAICKITPAGAVSTLAGVVFGQPGQADGEGPAARFNEPNGIAVDSSGVVYVADTGNHTIRRISPSGSVTTLAGLAGSPGSPEDAVGAAARFISPTGLAVAPDGSLYVADRGNKAVRRVTPAGAVTTIAGKWTPSVDPSGDGEGDSARFGELRGLAVGGGGVIYTAEYTNHTIRIGTRRMFLRASTAALRFGATRANGHFVSLTPPQDVTVMYGDAPPGFAWATAVDQSWVQIGSAGGPGRLTVSVTDPGSLPAGATTATATITLLGPANTTTTIAVVLTIQSSEGSTPAFGAFDTPANNAAGLVGAIAVTGWALDNVGVAKVQLWRNCVEAVDRPLGACFAVLPGEAPDFVYIGDAAFLPGARPDVEVANLGVPLAHRAGWGYLMSTNALPHLTAPVTPQGGQGTFALSAYAIDVEGQFTLLGTKTIAVDNDNASIPFGVLDTPEQGGTITVSPYASFGWAMTQSGKCIDVTATTSYKVYIDGVSRTLVPNVNWFSGLTRPDIAAANPNRCNTNNALAAYYLDANALGLANGLHTTGWDVIDSAGKVAGVGSRFFNVLIGSSVTDVGSSFSWIADAATIRLKPDPTNDAADVRALDLLAASPRAIRVQLGPDTAPAEPLTPNARGEYDVQFGIGGRIVLDLDGGVEAGYQVVGDELRALPAGSTFDASDGVFAWQPPTPFLGPFHLVFISGAERIDVHATIVDPTVTVPIAMHIDTPAAETMVTGSFVIAGWALDPLAATGSGIDTLHVWAYRRDAVAPPQFLGAAAVGGRRPDVAAVHGTQFEAAGFTLTSPALPPGIYDLVTYPWSRRAGRFESPAIVRITVW